MNPAAQASPVIPGIPAPSDTEFLLAQAFSLGEPLLYLISFAAFLFCAVLLVIKTRAPGRFLILAAPVLLFLFWAVQKLRNPQFPIVFETSVLEIAFTRFFVALALFIGVVGYVRLVWWVYRSGRVRTEAPR